MRAGTGSFGAGRHRGLWPFGGRISPSGRVAAAGVSVAVLLALAACTGAGEDGEPAGEDSRAADSVRSDAGSGAVPDTSGAAADSANVGDWFLDADWRAIGTEPFWGVYIARDSLTYSAPGEDHVAYPPAEPGRAGDAVMLSSTVGGNELEIALRRAPCSDGMSDRRYEWSAEVTVAGRALAGCAIRDPFPTVVPDGGAIDEAGLTSLVESARHVRAQSGRYERVEGTLGRQRGADADFVGWFDGETLVALDLRITRGEVPLFETSYFLEPSATGDMPVLRLVESDRWDEGTREHTSYMIGYEPDGALIGGLYEVEGEPSNLPAGLAEGERAAGGELVDAAVAEWGRGLDASGGGSRGTAAGGGTVGA